ncbi:FkbM family methyltransferase [Methylobacter sp. S3L5C]|nr:WlaTC/HtrL family glycosyltransferase [Methylobacter sp. S3L5C]UOA07502.1 FkbM family methyltransferase [Methylobacter sp. S3L5C]
MLTINQQAIDTGKVHSCFGGMSSIYPPRNGLSSEGDAKTVELYGEMIEVNCITLNTLLSRHNLEALDIICIDAEGWDYKILRQLDFSIWRPKLIRCEYINLDEEEKKALLEIFINNDYVYHIGCMDIDAVTVEHWNLISNSTLPIQPTETNINLTEKNITLVTSVLQTSIEHSLSHPNILYEKVKSLLKPLESSIPVLIYSSPGPAMLAIKERNANSTYLITKEITELKDQALYTNFLQSIKSDSKSDSGKSKAENIAVINFAEVSKMFLLNDATLFNPFNTELFLWVDIEMLPEIVSSLESQNKILSSTLNDIANDARLFLPSITPNKSDIENLDLASQLWLGHDASDLKHKATGSIFGGCKSVINSFNAIYYNCINRLLDNKIKCSASTVLTLSSCSHQDLCNINKKIAIKEQILSSCKRLLKTKE